MNSNESYRELFLKMKEDLGDIQIHSSNRFLNIKESYRTVVSYCKRVIPQVSYESNESEIEFYKKVRPSFEAELYYLAEVFTILSAFPDHQKELRKFLESQFTQIQNFRRKYHFLYEYYRLQRNDLDSYLFLKKGNKEVDFLALTLPLEDESSTSAGKVFAYFKAFEELSFFLNKEISGLEKRVSEEESTFKWTAPKVALVELAYALKAAGAINNGNSTIREIANILEKVFQQDLSQFYRTFQEIRIRKNSRTTFLDRLKIKLETWMDNTDFNGKGES